VGNPKRRQVSKNQARYHGYGIAKRAYLKMHRNENAAKHRKKTLPKPWEPKHLRFNFGAHRLHPQRVQKSQEKARFEGSTRTLLPQKK